jgi:hypothetical protein
VQVAGRLAQAAGRRGVLAAEARGIDYEDDASRLLAALLRRLERVEGEAAQLAVARGVGEEEWFGRAGLGVVGGAVGLRGGGEVGGEGGGDGLGEDGGVCWRRGAEFELQGMLVMTDTWRGETERV